jgi:valyl-tRNA synthetase
MKQREKLEREEQKSRSRLDNEQFIQRAPAEVVEAEKKKLSDIRAQLELISKNLKSL